MVPQCGLSLRTYQRAFIVVHLVICSFRLGCFYLVPGAAALDFNASTWIWTDEVSGGNAPSGHEPSAKTGLLLSGKTPVQADIIMTVDNGFTLYVNGVEQGTGEDFRYANRFCVALRPCLNVFAVTGVNTGVPLSCLQPSR
ncbi:hypothetical protein MVEN_02633100 [Mycena venus]|uniref:Bacterial alpha-L-rhamnosidase N-terminal domain-containing protein n=1 Tax=Mycena venus TaxID=2733690 RepID=A0A8H6TTZ6_9AGAR|nr:hypothetical protein MVEN_02633100 [Mycena venus]